jgi:predicted enzyme related to lactoylglutathione lyase
VTTAGCREVPAHWLPYVHVPDVDGAATRARQAGGQVRMIETIPGVGRLGVLAEPGGAVLALLSPRPAPADG